MTDRRLFTRKLDLARGTVDMSHGSGGKAMAQLVRELFADAFANPLLEQGNDATGFAVADGRLVVTTDGFVVSPLFFPGGDIGSLAVHGTVNDVAMAGAVPLYLTAGFILEEGFPLADLKRIVDSMAAAARQAGVQIVAGDTKVVERGKGDGVFITTTGIGRVPAGVAPSGDRARPGDAILVSGTLGDHGVAIMSTRENLAFEAAVLSDSAALNGLVDAMVAAACELLGLDPLYVANEGKLIAICAAGDAEALLAAMRSHPLGREAARIGTVVEDTHRFVQMETRFGGKRIVDWLSGEQLPRIC